MKQKNFRVMIDNKSRLCLRNFYVSVGSKRFLTLVYNPYHFSKSLPNKKEKIFIQNVLKGENK